MGGPVSLQGASLVAHDEVARAGGQQQACHPQARRPGTADDDPRLIQPLLHQRERVEEPGQHHDPSPVGVVVKDGDIDRPLQVVLEGETLRRNDVLQHKSAEAGGQHAHSLNHLVEPLDLQTHGQSVNAGERLEDDRLALHHRQGRLGTDASQAEDG